MKHILLATLLLLGCSKTETVQKGLPAKSSYKRVSTLNVKSCDSLTIRKAVTVIPYETFSIESPIDGVVDSLFINSGDFVSVGDTLLLFDSRELVAEIRLQKLRVAAAKSDMDRVAALYKKGVRTSVEKENSENIYREESALLRLLRLRFESYTLISTVTGTVVFMENSKTFIGVGEEVCQIKSDSIGVEIPAEFHNRSIIHSELTFPALQKKIVIDSLKNGWFESDLPIGTAGVMTLTMKVDNCYSVSAKYHGGTEGSMVELVSESSSVLGEVVAVTDSLIYITAERKIDDTSQFTDIRVIQ